MTKQVDLNMERKDVSSLICGSCYDDISRFAKYVLRSIFHELCILSIGIVINHIGRLIFTHAIFLYQRKRYHSLQDLQKE